MSGGAGFLLRQHKWCPKRGWLTAQGEGRDSVRRNETKLDCYSFVAETQQVVEKSNPVERLIERSLNKESKECNGDSALPIAINGNSKVDVGEVGKVQDAADLGVARVRSRSNDLFEGTNSCSDSIEVSSSRNRINKAGSVRPSISTSSGTTISDNDIRRCNLKILNDNESETSVKAWKLCKELGVINIKGEENMIEQVEDLESRDKLAYATKWGKKRCPMMVLSMNIRGLGCRCKKYKIISLIREEQSDFVAIQERKLSQVDNSLCVSLWGDSNVDWVFQPAVGNFGGLLSMWSGSRSKLKYFFLGMVFSVSV